MLILFVYQGTVNSRNFELTSYCEMVLSLTSLMKDITPRT